MFRPPGESFYYTSAYIIGLMLLTGLTWAVCRFLKQKRIRPYIVLFSIVVAITAASALRQEYHIQRAEACHRYIQRIKGGEDITIRTHTGFSVRKGPDGVIRTNCGTPEEVEAFLSRKYSGWFSGSIVKIRNALLPTTGCTLSTEGAPSVKK